VDQRITCSAWFPGRPEVCGNVWPSSQTSGVTIGRLEVTQAVNFQTSDSQRMANQRACAQPTPSLSTVSRQEGRRKRNTNLSDVCMIYQTSDSGNFFQNQGATRPPLATPPASYLARLLLRPQQVPLRVAPHPLHPPPAGEAAPASSPSRQSSALARRTSSALAAATAAALALALTLTG